MIEKKKKKKNNWDVLKNLKRLSFRNCDKRTTSQSQLNHKALSISAKVTKSAGTIRLARPDRSRREHCPARLRFHYVELVNWSGSVRQKVVSKYALPLSN